MTNQQKCECASRLRESILTLDGGGIRGYASLLILRQIMVLCLALEHAYDKMPDGYRYDHEVDNELPLPCHYFDYMFGTSTGGIIAIMLGRLRMSIGDCLTVYKRFGRDIFGKKRRLWRLRYDKYNSRAVENLMMDIVREHCQDKRRVESPLLRDPAVLEKEKNNKAQRQRQRYVACRVGVLAVRKADKNDELYMLRSYHNPTPPKLNKDLGRLLNLNQQIDTKIWEAARATSAAPTYFSPMKIEGNDYMDGGLEANNPSDLAWGEVNSMHQNNPGGKCPSTLGGVHHLLSIGTGKGAERRINIRSGRIRRGISIVKKGLNEMTNPEHVHSHMERMAQIISDGVYSRFNVENGLEKIKLDEFKRLDDVDITLKKIEECVNTYLSEPDIIQSLEKVARRLVDHRRDRCKPGWRKYLGLSRRGPLDEIYLERFQWDGPEARPHDAHNNHPIPPDTFEMMNRSLPNGLEMPASPVQSIASHGPSRSPLEAPSSPLYSQTGLSAMSSSPLHVQTGYPSMPSSPLRGQADYSPFPPHRAASFPLRLQTGFASPLHAPSELYGSPHSGTPHTANGYFTAQPSQG